MGLTRLLRPKNEVGEQNGKRSGSSVYAQLRVIVAVLIVLNVALLVMALRPAGRSLVERQKQYQQSRMKYEATLASVNQMRDLQSKLATAIEKNRAFSQEHFLKRGTAFSAMVSELEQMAKESQLKPSTISYGLRQELKQPGFENVAVTLTLEGAYPDLVGFINRLEQSQLFWMIDSLNVSGSAGPGRGLRLNLIMETYAVAS